MINLSTRLKIIINYQICGFSNFRGKDLIVNGIEGIRIRNGQRDEHLNEPRWQINETKKEIRTEIKRKYQNLKIIKPE